MIGAIGYSEYLVRRTASLLRRLNGASGEPLLVGTDHSMNSDESGLAKATRREVLEDPSIHAIYVSSATGNHYQDCMAALTHGKHVLVEKPICLCIDQLTAIETAARQRKLVVAECLSYPFHPRWHQTMRNLHMYSKQEEIHLRAAFTIPHRSSQDFRYRREHGGIAADLGTYVIDSLLRAGIQRSQLELPAAKIHINRHSGCISTAGQPSGEAQWAIGGTYENTFTVTGQSFRIHLQRTFSPPADEITTLVTAHFSEHKTQISQTFPPTNATHLCLIHALKQIEDKYIGVIDSSRIRSRISIMERILQKGYADI